MLINNFKNGYQKTQNITLISDLSKKNTKKGKKVVSKIVS